MISQGTADFNAGDYDRAIANYNEAVKLDPKSANAFRGRGKAYRDKGDHSRAIADFNEAIQLDPKSALAFMDRGDFTRTKVTTTEPSLITMKQFDSIPRVRSLSATGASLMQTKAT